MVYNFIDSTIYKFSPPDEKQYHKEKLYFDSDKIHALTVASLRHENGIDILINAIKNVNSTNLHFHIVGLIENTEYSNSIFKAVKSSGLDSIVTFHGLKSPLELLEYYSASDFFILPSRREGFNVSILESTATGLPVLCTNVGGNKEVINDKKGVIIKPESVSELSKGIDLITKNLEFFNSKYISDTTISIFSEFEMKKRLENFYDEQISS